MRSHGVTATPTSTNGGFQPFVHTAKNVADLIGQIVNGILLTNGKLSCSFFAGEEFDITIKGNDLFKKEEKFPEVQEDDISSLRAELRTLISSLPDGVEIALTISNKSFIFSLSGKRIVNINPDTLSQIIDFSLACAKYHHMFSGSTQITLTKDGISHNGSK